MVIAVFVNDATAHASTRAGASHVDDETLFAFFVVVVVVVVVVVIVVIVAIAHCRRANTHSHTFVRALHTKNNERFSSILFRNPNPNTPHTV